MKIKVENLEFAYGDRKILSISEASMESGHIYGIVGQNGVGKTTFFKTLTNIITHYTGSVSIDGRFVKDDPSVLTKVGIMLDDMELYKAHSGFFNLRYFGGLRGGFDEAKALRLAHELGLTDEILEQKVSTYSLGMGKKLILLISLMNEAELLIFDEPFRGIDRASVEWFQQYLLKLKEEGKLILISSHVQEDIESLCDTVLLLASGDFKASYDLSESDAPMTYIVTVNRPDELSAELLAVGVKVYRKEQQLKFESSPSDFQETFKYAVNKGIVFEEIKKESQFVQALYEKSKRGE